MYGWASTSNWKVKVLLIPGDGNCIFSSLCHQLNGFAISSELHKEGTRRLRRTVVEHIWHNRYTIRIKNAITTRVMEDWPRSSNDNYDDQVNVVLSYLQTDGNWGGQETINSGSNGDI